MANAYGLNSGTVGQAALVQRNQLQEELNTLGAAQAAALTEIQRQRTVLGQQYQAAINQASAESDFQRLSALYQEAVRVEEALRQEEQYYTSLFLQYGQKLVGQLGSTMSSNSASNAVAELRNRLNSDTTMTHEQRYNLVEAYLTMGQISESEALQLLDEMGY